MSKKQYNDRVYLQHILESIRHVYSFSGGILDTLHEHAEPWFATLRALQLMSESCTHLSDEIQAKMPMIKWHRIRGFRNILVHDYLGDIDPEIIRKTIQIELPKLEEEVGRVLKEIEHGS